MLRFNASIETSIRLLARCCRGNSLGIIMHILLLLRRHALVCRHHLWDIVNELLRMTLNIVLLIEVLLLRFLLAVLMLLLLPDLLLHLLVLVMLLLIHL